MLLFPWTYIYKQEEYLTKSGSLRLTRSRLSAYLPLYQKVRVTAILKLACNSFASKLKNKRYKANSKVHQVFEDLLSAII